MRLEEGLDRCTETNPIGNRVGDKEVIIRFLPEENCYSLQEGRPWIVEPDCLIGACLTRDEVIIRVAEVSFASEMNQGAWVVNIERT